MQSPLNWTHDLDVLLFIDIFPRNVFNISKQLYDYFLSRSVGGWVSREPMSWHHCSSTAHLFPVCWWCHTVSSAIKLALRTDRELQITLNRKRSRPRTAMTSEPFTSSARRINHSCESSPRVGEAFPGKPNRWRSFGKITPVHQNHVLSYSWLLSDEAHIWGRAAGCGSLPHLTIVLQCGTCEWPLQVCAI